MTREEAIEILTKSIKWFKPYTSIPEEWEEAMSMAIEALHREEAEEKGYCHRIRPKGERREP